MSGPPVPEQRSTAPEPIAPRERTRWKIWVAIIGGVLALCIVYSILWAEFTSADDSPAPARFTELRDRAADRQDAARHDR